MYLLPFFFFVSNGESLHRPTALLFAWWFDIGFPCFEVDHVRNGQFSSNSKTCDSCHIPVGRWQKFSFTTKITTNKIVDTIWLIAAPFESSALVSSQQTLIFATEINQLNVLFFFICLVRNPFLHIWKSLCCAVKMKYTVQITYPNYRRTASTSTAPVLFPIGIVSPHSLSQFAFQLMALQEVHTWNFVYCLLIWVTIY